jgi:hypothetical protein
LNGKKQLLSDKPGQLEGPIPFLPLFNAGSLKQTQVKYLAFQNGEGVRNLTHFSQAYMPISDRTIFYTFQGVTGDGAYYVSLVLPVHHPSLPADEGQIPGGDVDAFSNNFERYAKEVEEQPDEQADFTFIPKLALFDALVQSLLINEELPQGFGTGLDTVCSRISASFLR